MGKVYVFDHPLIQHKTAKLRDKKETATVIYCDDLFEIPVNPINVSGSNAVEKEYLAIFKK